jgi:hypothetical protein
LRGGKNLLVASILHPTLQWATHAFIIH